MHQRTMYQNLPDLYLLKRGSVLMIYEPRKPMTRINHYRRKAIAYQAIQDGTNGYLKCYEGGNSERACDTMPPENIPIGGYTHINFAFLYIDPDLYTITPMETSQQELYSRVTALKKRNKDLEAWISIGGWAFNDPGPTATTFSDLAASKSKQSTFFESLLSFLDKYGFDGVDLDCIP